ncbi:hypothetical protein K501DRAFT_171852 [Backusella circina FSU 941]|nr:hypothetical protein K501DRAFT_171852 [Backusella circina FSU 941]
MKDLMESEEWRLDSTHKTSKSFIDSKQDCYLFTIIICSCISLKGIPDGFFFITSNETTNIIAEWLTWVKTNHQLNVKRIMIDCASAEIAAIKQAMTSIQVLLCHWHFFHAWDAYILVDVKHIGGTKNRAKERKKRQSSII